MKTVSKSYRTVAAGAAAWVFLVAAAVPAAPARAALVVAPNAYASVAGESGNGIPAAGSANIDRYQQVFAGSQFGALGGPELITQIAFRRDEMRTTLPFTHAFSNVVVALSTTASAPGALAADFAANQGADLTVVHSGALTLASASSGGAGPQPFDIVIDLATPFLYDPAAGNLLLDWQNFGGETYADVFYDVTGLSGGAFSRMFAVDAQATTRLGADSVGLITQFRTRQAGRAAPEPSTLALLAAALLGLGALRRRAGQA